LDITLVSLFNLQHFLRFGDTSKMTWFFVILLESMPFAENDTNKFSFSIIL
jgi:hypothetical protein